MSKSFKKDLTGQRFGRLTVIEFVPRPDKPKHSYWLCNCDCGNKIIVMGAHLARGHTQSCGCMMKEVNTKHGGERTRLYRIWANMKYRCCNSNCHNYKDYGGRGITVCEEWKKDFTAFRDWALANGYRDDLTIDRIDVNGNYEPSNCRWVDMKMQNRNLTNNFKIDYNGKEMCMSEVSEISGINRQTLVDRYYRGDRGERLFRPVRPKNK